MIGRNVDHYLFINDSDEAFIEVESLTLFEIQVLHCIYIEISTIVLATSSISVVEIVFSPSFITTV